MNFAWLHTEVLKQQYDEIKIIGRSTEVNDMPCHIAAMLRQGEKVSVCTLMQTGGMPLTGQSEIMRDSLREQAIRMEEPGIQAFQIGDQKLEAGGGTGYYLETAGPDVMVLLIRLMEAGWQVPEDSIFYEMDWSRLIFSVYDFREPLSAIPDWENSAISVTWMPQYRAYLIQKAVRLAVADEEEGVTGEQELAFTIAGQDGKPQKGICYMNRVELVDVWKELEACNADPEYQKRALEHVTAEQFEEMKQRQFQILEQDCPRGMCYVGVEYECTLDVSLEFYSQAYLDSVPKVYEGGSATFFLSSSKPSSEQGMHGLKLRAAVIRTPVPPDTKEIQAELFLARRMIPEHEVMLERV